MHEATFDDELKFEAIAKKHSTTSEAIGVGVAMRARRVILTHFSQRYQNIPSMSALDTRSVDLEDAEDVDDPAVGMDQPIEQPTIPVKAQATIDNILESLSDESSQSQNESQSQPHVNAQAQGSPAASPTNTLAQIIASNINPTPRPQLDDMRVGVAFDYMRVKVGDIMHLDKFTPALMELYKGTADGAKNNKAAKEAFSDHEDDVPQNEPVKKVKNKEKKTKEEQAEKARKGQDKVARKRESREKLEKEKRMKDEESKTGEGGMEGGEVIEPVVEEKMTAVS